MFSMAQGSRRAEGGGGCQEPWAGGGRQKAVRSRPGKIRTAVIVGGGGPHNVRQISVEDYEGQRRAAG